MTGHYTNEEMEAKFMANPTRHTRNYETRTAIIHYGRSTVNYYMQHADGSWTNYDCKTTYSWSI